MRYSCINRRTIFFKFCLPVEHNVRVQNILIFFAIVASVSVDFNQNGFFLFIQFLFFLRICLFIDCRIRARLQTVTDSLAVEFVNITVHGNSQEYCEIENKGNRRFCEHCAVYCTWSSDGISLHMRSVV